MRTYYHWDSRKLRKHSRIRIFFAAILCSEICAAAFFVLILNICTSPDENVVLQMLLIISAAIFSGLLFCFVSAASAEKKIRRKSRYTYLDFQEKGIVYSSYSGEYRVAGERIIIRDLYLIPFEELSAVKAEESGRAVIICGKIRHYCMNSDNLGYHIRKGDFEFDRPFLNVGGFTAEEKLRIPYVFMHGDMLADRITKAHKIYLERPKPKPYVFKEAEFIRRRPKARTLPESFDYSRSWNN